MRKLERERERERERLTIRTNLIKRTLSGDQGAFHKLRIMDHMLHFV